MSAIKELKIQAFLFAENIDLKNLKDQLGLTLHSSSPVDLFYSNNNSYLYILDYGIVAYAGYSEPEIKSIIEKIKLYSYNPLKSHHREDFLIKEVNTETVSNNSISVNKITPEIVKITMLNVCQSVALDFYTELSQNLLTETVKYTKKLEKYGRLSMSKVKLLKFTGRALSIRNQIIDNLYILDAPDIVWEAEHLEKIHTELSRAFDLKSRFKELDYTLKIGENNLTTFSNLIQHRESNLLELIIILLITFEIIYSFWK